MGSAPIVVLGASGRTGALVVAEGLRRELRTLAVVRNSDQRARLVDQGAEVLILDPTDRAALTAATPRDAIFISCIGFSGDAHQTPQTDAAVAAVEAVRSHGSGRVVAISATGAFLEGDRAPMRAVKTILGRFFEDSYADTRSLEAAMAEVEVDVTCVRPPRLTNGPARGYRQNTARDVPGGGSISRADLAAALIDFALSPDTYPVVRVAAGRGRRFECSVSSPSRCRPAGVESDGQRCLTYPRHLYSARHRAG